MSILKINKKQLREGWEAPFHLRFLIVFLFLGTIGYYLFFLLFAWIFSFFIEIKTFQASTFLTLVILATIAFVLFEIDLYKGFHKARYLHYCKTLILSQIIVLIEFLIAIVWICI